MIKFALAFSLAIAVPAHATVYTLNYHGTGSDLFSTYDERGVGYIDLQDGLSTATLTDGLLGFDLSTSLVAKFGGVSYPPIYSYSSNHFSLSDVHAFSAQTTDGVITSLYLIASNEPAYPKGDSPDFSVYSLNDVASSPNGSGKPLYGSITATIPEPASWLTMLVGFFAVGLGFRSRRGAGLSAPSY